MDKACVKLMAIKLKLEGKKKKKKGCGSSSPIFSVTKWLHFPNLEE